MMTRVLPRILTACLATLLTLGIASCKKENADMNKTDTTTVGTGTTTTTPSTSAADDTALRNSVEANLTKYNVTGVTVDVTNGEVTLKGNVPQNKLQDAMKAANEANPKKVNNQMNVQ
jgi:osmotically-inducible protein OsmY